MGKDDVPGILMECIGDTVGYIIHNMTCGSVSNCGKHNAQFQWENEEASNWGTFWSNKPIYKHVHIHITSHSMRLHRTESCHNTIRHNITQHNTTQHITPQNITSHHIHASHTCITCVHHTTHPPCFTTLCIIYMYSCADR